MLDEFRIDGSNAHVAYLDAMPRRIPAPSLGAETISNLLNMVKLTKLASFLGINRKTHTA